MKSTIATMILVLPDGREYSCNHDFGHEYPEQSAEFMLTEGNYSCDCNRSIILNSIYSEVPIFDCGETIILKDLHITTT